MSKLEFLQRDFDGEEAEAQVQRMNLQTGDLILFDGVGKGSFAAQTWTLSQFSHASMVWRCPVTGVCYSWEVGWSTPGSVPSIRGEHRNEDTAHLTPLSVKFFKVEPGIRAYVRRLRNKEVGKTIDEKLALLFVTKHLGADYERGTIDLWLNQHWSKYILFSDYGLLKMMKKKESWICSAFIAHTYAELGVMKIKHTEHHLSMFPRDFGTDRAMQPYLKPCNGFYLDAAEQIVF